ncbi:MAG TPA: hypothetical protein VFC43_06090 [Methanoregula sp.]|nr:hypothetical protein [Methanoregula sp.]
MIYYISDPHQSKSSIERVSIYILSGVARSVAKPEINRFSGVLFRKAMHHEPVRTRFFVPCLPVMNRTIAISDPDAGDTKSADFYDLLHNL